MADSATVPTRLRSISNATPQRIGDDGAAFPPLRARAIPYQIPYRIPDQDNQLVLTTVPPHSGYVFTSN